MSAADHFDAQRRRQQEAILALVARLAREGLAMAVVIITLDSIKVPRLEGELAASRQSKTQRKRDVV